MPETNSTLPTTKKRQDIDTTVSSYKGLGGFFETLIRRFRTICYLIFLIPLYSISAIFMGIALVPGIYFFVFVQNNIQNWPHFYQYLALGITIAMAYFLYGFTLVLTVPIFNWIFRLKLKPWRGIFHSLQTIPWMLHNSLTYILRFTFLDFITPTPWNIFFFRSMGMKIGRGVMINTTYISDPSLIELEDKVTIGGSVTLIAHYGMGGYLIIAPVKIGKGAVIGMRAIIMGDVEIGENAKILPNSVVMPKTRIPANEIWGGSPAQFIRHSNEPDTTNFPKETKN